MTSHVSIDATKLASRLSDYSDYCSEAHVEAANGGAWRWIFSGVAFMTVGAVATVWILRLAQPDTTADLMSVPAHQPALHGPQHQAHQSLPGSSNVPPAMVARVVHPRGPRVNAPAELGASALGFLRFVAEATERKGISQARQGTGKGRREMGSNCAYVA